MQDYWNSGYLGPDSGVSAGGGQTVPSSTAPSAKRRPLVSQFCSAGDTFRRSNPRYASAALRRSAWWFYCEKIKLWLMRLCRDEVLGCGKVFYGVFRFSSLTLSA